MCVRAPPRYRYCCISHVSTCTMKNSLSITYDAAVMCKQTQLLLCAALVRISLLEALVVSRIIFKLTLYTRTSIGSHTMELRFPNLENCIELGGESVSVILLNAERYGQDSCLNRFSTFCVAARSHHWRRTYLHFLTNRYLPSFRD